MSRTTGHNSRKRGRAGTADWQDRARYILIVGTEVHSALDGDDVQIFEAQADSREDGVVLHLVKCWCNNDMVSVSKA